MMFYIYFQEAYDGVPAVSKLPYLVTALKNRNLSVEVLGLFRWMYLYWCRILTKVLNIYIIGIFFNFIRTTHLYMLTSETELVNVSSEHK